MRHNITQDEAPERIRDRQPFQASALSGVKGSTGTGDLPAELAELYEEVRPSITYTVLSYRTPIAWYIEDGGWHLTACRWSVTTTQHQGTVRGALRGYGPPWRGTYDVDAGRLVEHPDKPTDLFESGHARYVGEDERAVPAGHYEGVGPGYYA